MSSSRGLTPGSRALGAIGGATGVLPLVAVGRAAALKVFSVPRLPGAERLTSDVKEASYLEAAVIMTAVPLGAFFFGWILPGRLEARGVSRNRAHLVGAGFGSSFVLWRSGVTARAAVGVGLLLAIGILGAPLFRRSKAVAAAGIIGLVLLGLTASYRPANRLNLFEDGQVLFGASALASGARPYVDHFPVHGWGSDGGIASLFFHGDLRDLKTFRLLRAALTALAIASLGAAAWLFFADGWWGLVGLIASLAFCPFLSERHTPALLSLCVVIWAARSRKRAAWFWAGSCSAVTLFATLDFGVIFLIGGLTAPLALVLVSRGSGKEAGRDIGRFALGALIGSAPFLLRLTLRGALKEFFRVSFVEIPALIIPTWGFPADSFSRALREGSLVECLNLGGGNEPPGLCLLFIVLVSAALLLLVRAYRGAIDAPDRAATVSLLLAVLALRGVLGRADLGHRMLYGVLAGLPTTWLLYRASRFASEKARPLVLLLAALGFCVILRPDRVVSLQLVSVLGSGEQRRVEARAAAPLPGCPSATLPLEQVREILDLRRFIDDAIPPGRTFFEFGNEPGLYFLLERKAPIRFSNVALYETAEKQLEVIRALERVRPPVIILSSGTLDVLDSVPNRQRAPLVARYLDEHYANPVQVGPRTVVRLKDP